MKRGNCTRKGKPPVHSAVIRVFPSFGSLLKRRRNGTHTEKWARSPPQVFSQPVEHPHVKTARSVSLEPSREGPNTVYKVVTVQRRGFFRVSLSSRDGRRPSLGKSRTTLATSAGQPACSSYALDRPLNPPFRSIQRRNRREANGLLQRHLHATHKFSESELHRQHDPMEHRREPSFLNPRVLPLGLAHDGLPRI